MIMVSVGGSLARGGGLRLTSHKPRCLRIFLIISESSINEIILIDPAHLGHNKGSIPPGRDKFFELNVPNFFERPEAIYLIQLMPELDHRCQLLFVIHAIYLSKTVITNHLFALIGDMGC